MAVKGWRLPRGLRKSGIAANTSMSGRGCAIIRLHRWQGLWLMWGMPGKAKPHLEHNPLSLLGACHATPRRKLNDPARGGDPIDLVYTHCAALDVHKKQITACRVVPDPTGCQVDGVVELQEFGTM